MKSALAYNKDYAFNAICPYYTMFPLEYPIGIIRKYRRDNPVILDPFCGRGTTIYAARKYDLRSYGLDTSLIAASIAQAKVASAKSDAVLELAEKLLATKPSGVPDTEFFRRGLPHQLCWRSVPCARDLSKRPEPTQLQSSARRRSAAFTDQRTLAGMRATSQTKCLGPLHLSQTTLFASGEIEA